MRNTPIAVRSRWGSPPLSRSDISDWRDATLYPLAAAARRDDRPSVAQHRDPLASCFVEWLDRGDDGAGAGALRSGEVGGRR